MEKALKTLYNIEIINSRQTHFNATEYKISIQRSPFHNFTRIQLGHESSHMHTHSKLFQGKSAPLSSGLEFKAKDAGQKAHQRFLKSSDKLNRWIERAEELFPETEGNWQSSFFNNIIDNYSQHFNRDEVKAYFSSYMFAKPKKFDFRNKTPEQIKQQAKEAFYELSKGYYLLEAQVSALNENSFNLNLKSVSEELTNPLTKKKQLVYAYGFRSTFFGQELDQGWLTVSPLQTQHEQTEFINQRKAETVKELKRYRKLYLNQLSVLEEAISHYD
jgi:ribosomal protein L29